jgi:hypothetical protein
MGSFTRWCCNHGFLRIFSQIAYIRAVGNPTFWKNYTLPIHSIIIDILETQLSTSLYTVGYGASLRPKGPMPWMSAVIQSELSMYVISMLAKQNIPNNVVSVLILISSFYVVISLAITHVYRVGWFWTFFTFSTKAPLRFVTCLPKVPKIAKKKVSHPVTASSLVTTFWVMHYIRVQHFYSQYGLHGYQ